MEFNLDPRIQAVLLPAVVAALVFAGLLLYGADRREVALGLALAQALLMAAALSMRTRAGEGAPPLGGLLGLFAALVAWSAFQLAPFPRGMAGAAWAALNLPGAVTLDRFATLVELAKLLGLGAAFVLGSIIGRDRRYSRPGLQTLGAGGVLYCAWAVAGYYFGDISAALTPDHRLTASLPSPNVAASVLGVFAILGWTKVLLSLRDEPEAADWRAGLVALAAGFGGRRWVWLLLTAVALWAMALTASRGGALATAAGVVVATIAARVAPPKREDRVGSQQLRTLPLLLLGCLVAVLVSGAPLTARLAPDALMVTDRADYIGIFLSRLRDVPFTGFGLGTFQRFNGLLVTPTSTLWSWELGGMHNVYLQWLYEAGPPGTALMCACIGWPLFRIARALRRRRSGRAWMISGLAASALFAVHGLVDIDLQFSGVASLWAVILGAGYGAATAGQPPVRSKVRRSRAQASRPEGFVIDGSRSRRMWMFAGETRRP